MAAFYARSTRHRADRLAFREAPGHNRRLHDIRASPLGANMLTRILRFLSPIMSIGD